jgi:protein gp37
MNQKLIDKGIWWEEGVQIIDGCTPCSPGCDNCWSAALTNQFYNRIFKTEPSKSLLRVKDKNKWEFNGNLLLHPERLARFNTRKPKVFAIWNDLYHSDVPDSFIIDVFANMFVRDKNTYVILTKRPQRMADFLSKYEPQNHIHNGCTICTQPEADEKIPVFLQVPGKKFLCLEPLLEEIDIDFALPQYDYRPTYAYYRAAYPGMEDKPVLMKPGVDAVIVGTETGPHRRPAKLEWIESIIDQCDAAGVPVFVKALEINGKVSKDMSQWPAKFRRRELPWA